jgi:hypothetical protein
MMGRAFSVLLLPGDAYVPLTRPSLLLVKLAFDGFSGTSVPRDYNDPHAFVIWS